MNDEDANKLTAFVIRQVDIAFWLGFAGGAVFGAMLAAVYFKHFA